MKKLVPEGDNVLVIDSDESTVLDGIELPSNAREKEMLFGTVVAVGPGARAALTAGGRVAEGTVVCYGPYAGINIILNGVQFRLMRAGQVAGHIEESNESVRENVA